MTKDGVDKDGLNKPPGTWPSEPPLAGPDPRSRGCPGRHREERVGPGLTSGPDIYGPAMTETEVRRATVADAEGLAATYRSAYRENDRLGFSAKAGSADAETVAGWIEDARVYVARAEGGIVGSVRFEVTDPGAGRVKLSRLGVREDWKGQGVGSRLLTHAEGLIRDWVHTTVWLTTPESWSSATTTRSSWRSGSGRCGSGGRSRTIPDRERFPGPRGTVQLTRPRRRRSGPRRSPAGTCRRRVRSSPRRVAGSRTAAPPPGSSVPSVP